MGGVAEPLDPIVQLRSFSVLAAKHIGQEDTAVGCGHAGHFGEHAARSRKVMEGGAARNHLERRIRKGQVFGITMLEANIAKSANLGLRAGQAKESIGGVKARGFCATARESQSEKARPAGDIEAAVCRGSAGEGDQGFEPAFVRGLARPSVKLCSARELRADEIEVGILHLQILCDEHGGF